MNNNKCFILKKYIECLKKTNFAPYRCFEILEFYGKINECKK